MRRYLYALLGLVIGVTLSAATNISAETRYNFTADTERGTNFAPRYKGKRQVSFPGKYRKGTIIIKTSERKLYLVTGDGKALQYGVGVGRAGFEWSGNAVITRKAEWPGWTPPAAMRKREPHLPAYMPGGPNNPLGARALYLGSSIYRIHGTAFPHTIGQAVSSGCIRMLNSEVIDLYNRVKVGTRVIVKN